MAVTTARIRNNRQAIRDEIAAACERSRRDPAEVSIVAVTKSVDVAAVKNLLEAGITDLAENRAKPLVERYEEVSAYVRRRRTALPAPVRWHMVGTLQRNKVRALVPFVDAVHSVDSLRLAEEINTRAERVGRVIEVFLQVNCTEEPQKTGCAVGAAVHLAELLSTLRQVRLVGLMTMGPTRGGVDAARHTFVRLRELFVEVHRDKIGGPACRHLSMGMSGDYAVAVEEGATILRIGRALFK